MWSLSLDALLMSLGKSIMKKRGPETSLEVSGQACIKLREGGLTWSQGMALSQKRETVP